jgi:hypothetical protein
MQLLAGNKPIPAPALLQISLPNTARLPGLWQIPAGIASFDFLQRLIWSVDQIKGDAFELIRMEN